MVKLVTFTDAGDNPIYVNPALVTFVERPAVGVFGNAVIHFGGHQITVKEEPQAVSAKLGQAGDQAAPTKWEAPVREDLTTAAGSAVPSV